MTIVGEGEPKLTWGRTADGYVVRVDGRGTMRESPALRELGTSCLDNDLDARLTVDLSHCDYLDSTFLGCLVALFKHGSGAARGRLVIAAPVAHRKALLSPSTFDQYFNQIDVAPAPLGKQLTICPSQLDSRALGRHVMECHRELAQVEGPHRQAFARVTDMLADELGEG